MFLSTPCFGYCMILSGMQRRCQKVFTIGTFVTNGNSCTQRRLVATFTELWPRIVLTRPSISERAQVHPRGDGEGVGECSEARVLRTNNCLNRAKNGHPAISYKH